MMSTPRSRNLAGFTLVELLVVIGIISLLIAVLLPAVSKARNQARTMACAANLRSIGQGLSAYGADSGYFPGSNSSAAASGVTMAIWPTRIRKFLNGNQDVFYCPSQEEEFRWETVTGTGPEYATSGDRQYGYRPGERLLDVFKVPASYGYNTWGTDFMMPPDGKSESQRGLGGDIRTGWSLTIHEVPITRAKNPSDLIAIADGFRDNSWDFSISPSPAGGKRQERPGRIHQSGANVLFVDGHVEWSLQSNLILWDYDSGAAYTPGSPQWIDIARRWNLDNKP